MQYAYLGFVQLLRDLINTIFTTVLQPILLDILEIFVDFVVNVIWILLSDLLITLFAAICSLLDQFEKIFNIFSGASSVTASWIADDWMTVSGKQGSVTLLEALFRTEGINLVFRCITLMSFGICLIFTIYKTAKSISDMTLEDKNPISKVLTDTLKAMVTFTVIPFLCVFLLQLSSVITIQANAAFASAQGGGGSLGTIVFLSASMDADVATMNEKDLMSGEITARTDTNNNLLDSKASTAASKNINFKIAPADDAARAAAGQPSKIVPNITPTAAPSTATPSAATPAVAKPRYPSYYDTVRGDYMRGSKSYTDLGQVKKDFHVENFNYLAGFVTGGLLALVLFGALVGFVRRLFELLLLYLVSPFFVSTIPLDDGAVFSKWRDLFVAKFFSGFGMVFAMRYYLMMIPFLASSNLKLYDTTLPNGATINSIFQMFFIIGGAWAVYNSQLLIMQLLAPDAAMAEQQTLAMATGILTGSAPRAIQGLASLKGNGKKNEQQPSKRAALKQAKKFIKEYKSNSGKGDKGNSGNGESGSGGDSGDSGGGGD